MRITFIRHQKCYAHREDGSISYMTVNPPLTFQGVEGARHLTGDYDLVLISPMARCIETYVYSHINGPRQINSLFREWRQGPGDFHNHDPPTVFCETYENFQKRIEEGMTYLKSLKSDFRNVCVVTHSEWMKKALNLEHTPDYGEAVIRQF